MPYVPYDALDSLDSPPQGPTTRPVLPEGYYLEHFRGFIENIRQTYSEFLNEAELRLVLGFLELSHCEQQLFVRLSNRVGRVFLRSSLRYPEIPIDTALQGLRTKGFVSAPDRDLLEQCLRALHKRHLIALLELLYPLESRSLRSWSKERLQEEALRGVTFDTLSCSAICADLIVRRYAEELRYLCFLAFGDLRSDLKLYALRDLGIRRSNDRGAQFTRRFETPEEGRSEFTYRLLRESLGALDPTALSTLHEQRSLWPAPVGPGAASVRNTIIAECAKALLRAGRREDALRYLRLGDGDQVTEKRIRLLHTMGRLDEMRKELSALFEDPPSAALLFFAEDFSAQKLGRARKGKLTLALEQAHRVRLNASYRGRPEQGVANHLSAQGHVALHTENELWLSLFGILFWDELFEAEAAIHSEFDFMPSDLVSGAFYGRNEERVEAKLRSARCAEIIRETAATRYGVPNGLFSWKPGLAELLLKFVETCEASAADYRAVLRRLARDFERSRRGFPDLLILEHSKPIFAEVKSLGDKLQPAQLRQLRFLDDCGFETRIIRVEWDYDPNQVYVVVDVETTGLSPERNRIIEVGAVKIQNGYATDRLSTLVNPQCRIPRNITMLTGITQEAVSAAPIFGDIAAKLYDFFGDSIFVGHNAGFDHSFLAAEYRRLGRHFRRPLLCTRVEMRRAYPGHDSYGLENLCRDLGIKLPRHHRALCDAEATAELLLQQQVAM